MCFIEELMEITVWLEQDNFFRAYILVCLFYGKMIMDKYFKVENLCYAYLKKPLCLKDVNFSADKNDKVLILALDDNGKTTLLKTLSGFDEKFFGKVIFQGKEIRSIPDKEKNVSVIFDVPILLNSSIEKNIDYLFDAIGKEYLSQEEKLGLLKKFKLDYSLKAKVKTLSVFEKFKLCFLRVFVKNSKIVFIDNILKNDFNKNEMLELKEIFDMCLSDKLVFLAANDNSFVENKEFFDWFKPTKVLFVNTAIMSENKSIDEFLKASIDLDACAFNDCLTKIEGYCVRQDGSYFLSFEEKYVLKIDRSLNEFFDKLKLSEGENEDIVLVFQNSMQIDLTKNNDINKLLADKKLMIFSKIDRSRVI